MCIPFNHDLPVRVYDATDPTFEGYLYAGFNFFVDESLAIHALPEITLHMEGRSAAPPWQPAMPSVLEYRHDLVFEPTFVSAPYPRSLIKIDAAADRAGTSRDEVDVELSNTNLDPSVEEVAEAANALISMSSPPSVHSCECIEIDSDSDDSSQIQEFFDIDQSPPVWRRMSNSRKSRLTTPPPVLSQPNVEMNTTDILRDVVQYLEDDTITVAPALSDAPQFSFDDIAEVEEDLLSISPFDIIRLNDP